jgi:hypothetical protein
MVNLKSRSSILSYTFGKRSCAQISQRKVIYGHCQFVAFSTTLKLQERREMFQHYLAKRFFVLTFVWKLVPGLWQNIQQNSKLKPSNVLSSEAENPVD